MVVFGNVFVNLIKRRSLHFTVTATFADAPRNNINVYCSNSRYHRSCWCWEKVLFPPSKPHNIYVGFFIFDPFAFRCCDLRMISSYIILRIE